MLGARVSAPCRCDRDYMASGASSAAERGTYAPDADDDDDDDLPLIERPDYRIMNIRVGPDDYICVYLLVRDKESGWFGEAAFNELLAILRDELMQRLPDVMNQRDPKIVYSDVRGDTLELRFQYVPRVGKVWLFPGKPTMVDREYPEHTDKPRTDAADGPAAKRPKEKVGKQPRWNESYEALPYTLIINAERMPAAAGAPPPVAAPGSR